MKKNVLDASLGALLWGTVGFGLAFGHSDDGYYGTTMFFLTKDSFSDGEEWLVVEGTRRRKPHKTHTHAVKVQLLDL